LLSRLRLLVCSTPELRVVKCSSRIVRVHLTPLLSIACIFPVMADPRQYYVPSGSALNSASLNPPPVETRQLQSSLRAGRLQRKQTAAGTGLPKSKGQRHVSWAGDQRSSPAASVAAPKESSLETQTVVTGELPSPSIIDQQHSSPEKDSQMSNGSNAVIRDQLMTAVVRHKSARCVSALM
jgi:hypothetical protein